MVYSRKRLIWTSFLNSFSSGPGQLEQALMFHAPSFTNIFLPVDKHAKHPCMQSTKFIIYDVFISLLFPTLTSLLQGDSFSADKEKTGEISATLKKLGAFHRWGFRFVHHDVWSHVSLQRCTLIWHILCLPLCAVVAVMTCPGGICLSCCVLCCRWRAPRLPSRLR